MEKLLKVVNIYKKFEGQKNGAVINVSFAVNKGSLFVVVGESGSGKTTLLKLIAGLEDPDSGSILLENKEITGPAYNLVPGHKQIKMVFQDFRLFPNITIYHKIAYVLRSYHTAYQTERIQEVLELCKLIHLKNKYPRELSGGEQQRVALARALADEPLLLLLDEPFSNMDGLLKQRLKEDITDIITNSAVTALLVTHDTSDALSMATSIAVMQAGKIIQEDSPQAIYESPVSPYVARFFGNATIIRLSWLLPYIGNHLQSVKGKPYNPDTEVCIRAEHIYMVSPENAHFQASVVRISYMGAYYQVSAKVDRQVEIIFYTKNAALQTGDIVPLRIDIENMHYFESAIKYK